MKRDILLDYQLQRVADAERFAALKDDVCMCCGAEGHDKRSLFLDCGYDLHEAIPSIIDLWFVPEMKHKGYYLRICKRCRGEFLMLLKQWFQEGVERRGLPLDHDGHEMDESEATE